MTLSKSGVSRWPALPITLAVRVCVCVCVCVSRASPDGQLGVVNLFTDDGAILLSPELLSNAQRPSAKARIGFVTRRRIHVLKSRGGSLFSKLPFLYPFDLSPLLSFPFCPSHLLPCTCPSPNLPGSPLFVDRASPDCSTPCVSYYTCTEFVSPPCQIYICIYIHHACFVFTTESQESLLRTRNPADPGKIYEGVRTRVTRPLMDTRRLCGSAPDDRWPSGLWRTGHGGGRAIWSMRGLIRSKRGGRRATPPRTVNVAVARSPPSSASSSSTSVHFRILVAEWPSLMYIFSSCLCFSRSLRTIRPTSA